MAENSKIQWTHHTHNPWRGCTKVSEGCTFCYADTLSHRNPKVLGIWGPKGTRVLASDSQWNEPNKWARQAHKEGKKELVFCASLADVFEDWDGQMTDSHEMPLWLQEGTGTATIAGKRKIDKGYRSPFTLDHARTLLWKLIRNTPDLTWQLLTKRPENIQRMMPAGDWPNVWLGTSVESQEYLWRLDALQEAQDCIKCPVLFCSAEPLLGPLEFGGSLGEKAINWVIVGGESGGDARPFRLDWCKSIIHQCRKAEVACFVKQAGSNPESSRIQLHMTGKGGDPADWPAWMQVRQFPFSERGFE